MRPPSRILLQIAFVLIAICALSRVSAQTIVISATVTDALGRTTDAHTTLTVLALPDSITLGSAKSLADGTAVQVTGLVTSTSSSDYFGMFYAQQQDRSSGIGIVWDGGVNRGDVVSVVGTLVTAHGERLIQAQVVERIPASP